MAEDRPDVRAFATWQLSESLAVVAPDGSSVRVLLGLQAGGMAHFELAAGEVAHAVMHRTVEEVWYVLSGRGRMWRKQADREEIVELAAGACLTIPLGTQFQFRAADDGPLSVVAVTMPPWPGEGDAVRVVGPWSGSLP